MFLGDIIHKVERKDEHNVEVRGIIYKTNDEEFNEPILDYKGHPQISSMISKLCCYNPRTEFIIKVLNDFIKIEDIDSGIIEENKKKMDDKNPKCEICNKNNNYLVKNTCCENVKYCLLCMDNIMEYYKNNQEKTIDKDGNMQITDRSKDVIKSGGEWISSIEIESIASAFPDISICACISIPHPKWGERPLLIVVKKLSVTKNDDLLKKEILSFFDGKMPKWSIPDDVVFIDKMPLTATGKLYKMKIRELFNSYQFKSNYS
jgi:acyl-CoA synthetase (AMP-forming)/AMP-acid ligase II